MQLCRAARTGLDERVAPKQSTDLVRLAGKDRRPPGATAKCRRSKAATRTGENDQRDHRPRDRRLAPTYQTGGRLPATAGRAPAYTPSGITARKAGYPTKATRACAPPWRRRP